MPFLYNPKRNRPWRNATPQDVFDALRSLRQFAVQLVSGQTAQGLALSRIESRLASIEVHLGELAAPTPPGPADVVDQAALRELREVRAMLGGPVGAEVLA